MTSYKGNYGMSRGMPLRNVVLQGRTNKPLISYTRTDTHLIYE